MEVLVLRYVYNQGVTKKDASKLAILGIAFAYALTMVFSYIRPADAARDNGKKVDICHLVGNGSYRVISVSQNAVDAHVREHGDGIAGEFPFNEDCSYWQSVEDLRVNSNDPSGVDFNTVEGTQYLSVAEGTWKNGPVRLADASCFSLDGSNWIDGPDRSDENSERALELQVGEEFVDWGPCNEDVHEYEHYFTGDGELVNFRIFDGYPGEHLDGAPNLPWYVDNSGYLTVSIYQLVK